MRRYLRRFTQWLMRLLLRVGLLPASTRADTDTMGEYKRLMAEKDDPRPGLVLPDPNAPHADLIRRVRLYAQNGAKALAPLLDNPLPLRDSGELDTDAMDSALVACDTVTIPGTEADEILSALDLKSDNPQWDWDAVRAIHAAYNAPWTVIDGEVYEYESDKKRRVVQ